MLHLQQRTKVNVLKILNVLKIYGPMHVRGIARVANMHPITVSSLINRLGYFFEIENREVVPGFNTKIVSLKDPNIKIEDIERYLGAKRWVKGNNK